MANPDDISEDRGFKALFTAYPLEAFAVFLPEALAERGQPCTVELLQQESAMPELDEPSRFLDVALMARWPDGGRAVILLVEHWSQARKVDLRRVLWYVADLALRHPGAAVFPVVLVTDPGAGAVPDRWDMAVAGITTVALRVRVIRIRTTDLPRLRSLQNRVAAVLTVLAMTDAVEAVLAAMEQMIRSPGPLDDLERFLPFAMTLARMPQADVPRFQRRLQESGMINVITELKKEALARVLAEGRAEGKASGRTAQIFDLVERGVITRDAARAEIQRLIAAGAIPRELGQEALDRLPETVTIAMKPASMPPSDASPCHRT